MKLTLKEANKIFKNYDLGTVLKFNRLLNGYANINFNVKTTKGIFFLRICKEKTLDEINYEHKVMIELKNINFPTAFPILKRDKKYINKTSLGNVVLYEFMSGTTPKVNKQTVKEIAIAVAKLNSLKNWRNFKKKNTTNLQLCESLISKFSSSKNKYPEIFKYFKEETEFLSQPLKKKVPQGFVHGDIFPVNTIFLENKLKAIVDFEFICTDNLLYDMGVTINGFCFEGNRLNPKLVSLFLKEYDKIRKISSKEKELIYYYIRWGAHAMICWHINHLLNKKEAKKIKRVNYLINRIKSLRKLTPVTILSS